MSVREPFIDQFLLDPLSVLYGKLLDSKKLLYVEALRACTDSQLKAIFAYVRDNYSYKDFPSIAVLQKARIETAVVADTRSGRTHSIKHPWQEKQEKIKILSDNYAKNFMDTSPTAREAIREGWDWELRLYVDSVAWVQSQFIHGSNAIGWNGQVIFNYQQITDDMRRIFMNEMQRQAQTGNIDVAIPSTFITAWKENAAWKRSHAPQRTIVSSIAAPGHVADAVENVVAKANAPVYALEDVF